MAIAVLNNVPAGAHAFRVTLNLLQHSTSCPPKLKAAIAKLERADWDRQCLSDIDLQLIYGLVTPEVCETALAEWSVDTSKMRDYAYPYSSADWETWHTGDWSVDCRLCGHKHNRFEFPMENSNGNVIWTGSTCIQKFGVVVNGEATAERALDLLRKAMNSSKKMQSRSQWQEAHPDHEEVMDLLGDGLYLCTRRVPFRMWRSLPAHWQRDTRELAKKLRATLKYHGKNGYLTDQRTCDVWEPVHDEEGKVVEWSKGRLIKLTESMLAAWKTAEESDPDAEIRRYWEAWLKKHAEVMDDWQKRKVAYFRDRAYSREELFANNKVMVESIEARLTRKANEAKEDDYSDMAW